MPTDVTAASVTGLGCPATFATGAFTSTDGNPTSITLGFTPRYVKVLDVTDVTTWEYFEGIGAGNCLKTVAAGTQTIDTAGDMVINTDPGLNEPGESVLLSAAICGVGKLITWMALG